MLRVGQIERCVLKLGPLDVLLEIDLAWLDEPQVLVLVTHLLVGQWRRGRVAVGFLTENEVSSVVGAGDCLP